MSPKLKAALDYGPLIVFLAVFLLYRDQDVVLWGQTYPGLILATLVFVPLTVLANAVLWKKTGELSVMQLVTLVVVVVFGGLTIWLNDPRFIKMKPTLIYLTFAALLVVLGAVIVVGDDPGDTAPQSLAAVGFLALAYVLLGLPAATREDHRRGAAYLVVLVVAVAVLLGLEGGREPDVLALLSAVDALPPVTFCLGMPGWAPTLELTAHVRARPAPGWLRVRHATRNLAGGMFEEDCEVWDSTDRLVAQSRQLALAPRA